MSAAHLAKGSSLPPKKDGLLRLYSMLYCPYAERARLVLKLKNVPHDIVNVDLKNKPEWLFQLNPEGKVPVLDTGSQVIPESLDICDYLDKQYPEPQLYPKDPKGVQKDKKLINSFDTLIKSVYSAWFNRENKTLQEYLKDASPELQRVEGELASRGKFFGGDVPKMVDYMIWPWVERLGAIPLLYNEKSPLPEDSFSKLREWYAAMQKQKVIQEIQISADKYYKLILQYKEGVVNYDEI